MERLDAARTLAALVFALASCIEAAAPPAKDALTVTDVRGPEGAAVETACTPTGVERCFDARDDNCNGVIDEGCGLHTGILQFVIAWDAPDADVDLNVRDPSGEVADARGEPTNAGMRKDHDCPKPDCQGQNVENVYLAEGDPKRGRYRVEVKLEKLGTATAPVKVRLGARVGQRSFGMNVELSPGAGAEARTFEFSL